ncbi:hypothetical protein AB0K74_34990 [Streptomyces sp. NPDC056159]|uniref:hypothetical protein n=1 Tax=Streptomyces sp. NPDC056159 TaxID=3155537 RepID=UPI003430C2C2
MTATIQAVIPALRDVRDTQAALAGRLQERLVATPPGNTAKPWNSTSATPTTTSTPSTSAWPNSTAPSRFWTRSTPWQARQ